MSSAVAMNRRIAKENGGPTIVQEFIPAPSGRNGPSRVQGTPLQQCWRILNFHETRFRRKVNELFWKIKEVSKGISGKLVDF